MKYHGESMTIEGDYEYASEISDLEILEHSFMSQIRSLIDCIQILGVAETSRLASLLSQLDYNQYYAHSLPESEFILHPLVPAFESCE
jgi:hypothetical protein